MASRALPEATHGRGGDDVIGWLRRLLARRHLYRETSPRELERPVFQATMITQRREAERATEELENRLSRAMKERGVQPT